MRETIQVPRWFILVFVSVWIVGAIMLTGYGDITQSETGLETVIHEQYNFRLEHPTKWRSLQYGEDGIKGDRSLKLHIFNSVFEDFKIEVHYVPSTNPSLEEAKNWGDERIDNIQNGLRSRGETELVILPISADSINDKEVLRRKYGGLGISREDVYLVGKEGLFIFILQAPDNAFSNYEKEFEQILESFTLLD